MRFSLILATRGRTEELSRFLVSLGAQTFRNFHLIVVDQNEDARLVPILATYLEKFPIQHIRSNPGLSRARNAALPYATGEIVAFPDDDCAYPPSLLARVSSLFARMPDVDGIVGRGIDEQGRGILRYPPDPGNVARSNLRAASFALFLRRELVQCVGQFDESLGLGSGTPWQAAEETDYCLRALGAGHRIFYDPSFVIQHPYPLRNGYAPVLQRAFDYGAANGHVLRRHGFPWYTAVRHLASPMVSALLSVLLGRRDAVRYHWNTVRGRWLGWTT